MSCQKVAFFLIGLKRPSLLNHKFVATGWKRGTTLDPPATALSVWLDPKSPCWDCGKQQKSIEINNWNNHLIVNRIQG